MTTISAVSISEIIQQKFPKLILRINEHDPNHDWFINIPIQDHVIFAIDLSLQGDELHLSTTNFWLEWFPIKNESVVAAYLDVVLGLLAGKYRILELRRWHKVVGSKLQAPEADGWRTIGTYSKGLLPMNCFTSKSVLQNSKNSLN